MTQSRQGDPEPYLKECIDGPSSVCNEEGEKLKPLFSVGLISDIQYAPIPDGFAAYGAPRYYRDALEVTRAAAHHMHTENVNIILQLGDIIDGKCQDIVGNGGVPLPGGVNVGQACVKDVIDAFSEYTEGGQDRTIIHTYGNHCLYNLDRLQIQKYLGIPFVREAGTDELVGYYYHVHQHIRFVVIDSYDMCLIRRSQSGKKWRKADKIMRDNNPNYPEHLRSVEGMNGPRMRFVGFNGGLDNPQLIWLQNTIQEAQDLGQKVIILSHQPILPIDSGAINLCLMWNCDEILGILRKFRTTVIASFCGHAHEGGYRRDNISGIHFRVIEAALEHKPETYALLDIFDDKIVFRGQGKSPSATYNFAHMSGERPESAK